MMASCLVLMKAVTKQIDGEVLKNVAQMEIMRKDFFLPFAKVQRRVPTMAWYWADRQAQTRVGKIAEFEK